MERIGHQDLYEVLQVSPRAHPIIITKAFRLLAALYHPDNTQTGDVAAFKQVVEGYRVLSDPLRRAYIILSGGGVLTTGGTMTNKTPGNNYNILNGPGGNGTAGPGAGTAKCFPVS